MKNYTFFTRIHIRGMHKQGVYYDYAVNPSGEGLMPVDDPRQQILTHFTAFRGNDVWVLITADMKDYCKSFFYYNGYMSIRGSMVRVDFVCPFRRAWDAPCNSSSRLIYIEGTDYPIWI